MGSRIRIGDLTLDRGRHLVTRDSVPIALGPLSYKLLLALVDAAPDVVSHEQLIRSVWKGRPVTPETLGQRIKLLRDALSDDPTHPIYIEGVRGQGYRLVPPIETIPADSASPTRPRRPSPTVWVIGLLTVAAIAALVATLPGMTERVSRAGGPPDSIAVLPFIDLSEEGDQQYLADGIAEDILNLLSRTTGLRVIAATSSFSSYRRKPDPSDIAKALGVTHVLEGSVRKAADRVRVTVRLLEASRGHQLWAESYDLSSDDILTFQYEVARSVAFELHSTLRTSSEISPGTTNPQSYDLYLRGQQMMRERSYGEARRLFEQIVVKDPDFIPAYAALGSSYVMDVVDVRVDVTTIRESLRDIVNRGLARAPHDAGLMALSAQLARYDGNMTLAESTFAAALRRQPSNNLVRSLYPAFKLDRSDPRSALQLSRESLQIDPYNPFTYILIWASHMDLWQREEAMAAATRYLELSAPHDISGEFMIGATQWLLVADFVDGIRALERSAARIEPEYAGTPGWLPLLHYNVGDLNTADALLARALATPWNDIEKVPASIYGDVAHGRVAQARRRAVDELAASKDWGGAETDIIIMRLAVDELIARGEAQRAVDFIESIAPVYSLYKSKADIDAADFSPAPVAVKSAFTSYPALYFTHYARALRASGDERSAMRMLDHLDAVLALRRRRGLFVEERYAAEASALRGNTNAALDALEKAERDRTIYHWWQTELLHNPIFADLRTHPRFVTLLERIQADLSAQRDKLRALQPNTRSATEPSRPHAGR